MRVGINITGVRCPLAEALTPQVNSARVSDGRFLPLKVKGAKEAPPHPRPFDTSHIHGLTLQRALARKSTSILVGRNINTVRNFPDRLFIEK